MDKLYESLMQFEAWILLLGFFAGYIIKGINKIKAPNLRQDDQIARLEVGMKSLLRSEIVRSIRKCQIKKYRTLEETEAVTGLYDAYLGVGGNGAIKDLYRSGFLELEFREKYEHEDSPSE